MDLATPILTQGVLGVSVVALSFVVAKLYNKIERLEKDKSDILEAWRLETKTDGKDALEVLKGNSQNMFYLAEKIEVAKKAER